MNDQIQKMHEAKRDARDDRIWEAVQSAMQRESCACGLRKGMKREELPSGSGCKVKYVCPALDVYRRMLPAAPIDEKELLMQEPWRMLDKAAG